MHAPDPSAHASVVGLRLRSMVVAALLVLIVAVVHHTAWQGWNGRLQTSSGWHGQPPVPSATR